MRVGFKAMRLLLVLIVFEKESRASDCYQCNSRNDKNCSINEVHPKYLLPCLKTQPYCRKAVYVHYYAGSGDYQIVRECARWQNADKYCYRGRYIRDSYQLVCECRGSACNPASTSASGSALLCLLVGSSCLAAYMRPATLVFQ